MALYALTIFIGSFLLFQVEPLIGRYILPWYGGGPAVWTSCLLFFQVVLLAGYGYAHLATCLPRRKQGYLHLALLAAALCTLPIAPDPGVWKPAPGDDPTLKILLLLVSNVGAPYLVLSATAPLLQHWFVRSFPGRSPYRLYALSNLGSLIALLSYPFLVEPNLVLDSQVSLWCWSFAFFACACAACALLLQQRGDDAGRTVFGAGSSAEPAGAPGEEARPPVASVLLWLLLSALGSVMLLAGTNLLCQDVAVVPFLWVIPLVLYLASFTVAFESERASDRTVWGVLLVLAFAATCWQLMPRPGGSLALKIGVHLFALFSCCMALHGELARSRPHPRQLTAYYLIISVGGALGGVFVALVAPLVFNDFWEYPIALAGSSLVLLVAWRRAGVFRRAHRLVPRVLALLFCALSLFLGYHVYMSENGTLASMRNFYGVLKLYRDRDALGERLVLLHGQVKHGWQYAGPLRRLPTAYYGADGGAGLALANHPRRFAADPSGRALRVGVIGLGAGTLASYGQPGDLIRFFEINPAVIDVAQRYFSFCRDSAARVEFVPGDARIVLEAELKQNRREEFDLLIVDAFSGDAIPIHLLTRECFALYRQHLKKDGLLLVHISNKYLDLTPVVRTQGARAGYLPVLFRSPGSEGAGTEPALWSALIPDLSFLNTAEVSLRGEVQLGTGPKPLVWTDDFASLWHILKK